MIGREAMTVANRNYSSILFCFGSHSWLLPALERQDALPRMVSKTEGDAEVQACSPEAQVPWVQETSVHLGIDQARGLVFVWAHPGQERRVPDT